MRETFRHVGAKPAGVVSLIFVTNREIRRINRRFRKVRRATDVIAFRYDRSGRLPVLEHPLGDVFISTEQARRQARRLGHPLLREILFLVSHGALHLLDFRDHTPRRLKRMLRLQEEVLSGMGYE